MADRTRPAFSAYARQKIIRVLLDLVANTKDLTWSGIANDITDLRGVYFQRNNLNRLRAGTLRDDNIEISVQWIEARFDPDIRKRLVPQGIFDEVGRSSRDYYFHLPAGSVVEDFNSQIMDEFSGLYQVSPAGDPNSFLPLPFLRRYFANRHAYPDFEGGGRTIDTGQYVSERSFLVLMPSSGSYFYAAEFPMAYFLPTASPAFSKADIFEGVGIVSANSIHVYLRDCLARVPRQHTILISQKTRALNNAPMGLSFYVDPNAYKVREDWSRLSDDDLAHLKREHALTLESDVYLTGPTQMSSSPLQSMKRAIGMTFGREHVFHKKPRTAFNDPESFFINPDIFRTEQVERILNHPLTIGELL